MYQTEHYVTLTDFPMPQLERKRQIRLFLPTGYFDSNQNYPVLYMHDGQNVFFDHHATYGKSWRAGEALSLLQREGVIPGIILVAIDCGQEFAGRCRFNEYSPWKMDEEFFLPSRWKDLQHMGGEGALYLSFIIDTLKPYIDEHYRTRPERQHCMMAGSSMGGLFSLYAGLRRPDIFSRVGVFSPAFWFNQNACMEMAESLALSSPLKVYMDMGGNETSDPERSDFPEIYLKGSREIADALRQKKEIDLRYEEFPHDTHNELAWARRFPSFIRWAMKNR
ncbi:alpha/beta hydrolase [Vibrio cholerae]|nr:alpha/beta hydrolase [Vibrio cholerae]